MSTTELAMLSTPESFLESTQTANRAAGQPIPICFVIGYVANEKAGTEGHLLRLIRRLDRTKFDPYLVVMQRTEWTSTFSDPLVPMDVLDFDSFTRPNGWKCVARLRQIFKRHGTQIVELHMIDGHFGGALAARWAKVPVILSCRRDLGHQYNRKILWMSRLANPLVTRFVANSQEVVRRISALEGTDQERFTVISNGVDLVTFDQHSTLDVESEFDKAITGKKVVSIVANLRTVKNHACFLHAAKLVTEQMDDVVFAVMGEGDLEADLRALASELGIADKILWLGSVESAAPYLRRSNVACLSSDSEGFSNAIVEYMAASLPVVATSVGGAAELIVEGETGFMVEPGEPTQLGEKLIQLLRLPDDARREMGAVGRRRIEQHFTMEKQMDLFESFYQAQLEQRLS